MFGVFGTLVSQLGVKGAPVLGSLLSLAGYADTTFYGSSVRLELSWRRTSQPQQTPIKVEKLTSQYLNATYYLIGKKPLVAQYIVVGQ